MTAVLPPADPSREAQPPTYAALERIERGLNSVEEHLRDDAPLDAEVRTTVAVLLLSLEEQIKDFEGLIPKDAEPREGVDAREVLDNASTSASAIARGTELSTIITDQRRRAFAARARLAELAGVDLADPVLGTAAAAAAPIGAQLVGPATNSERGGWRRAVSMLLPFVGCVVLGFLAFQLVASDLLAAREQQVLRDELDDRLTRERAAILIEESEGGTAPGSSLEAFAEVTGDEELAADAAAVEASGEILPAGPGDALALLEIPALDLEQVVVEGSSADALKKGPGHYRGSSMPGQRGNVVIAGRRSTYGSPFADLDRLEEGDEIRVSVAQGTYVYEVSEIREIEPGDEDVLDQKGENLLTLITANPAYRASGRLAVIATYSGSDENAPLLVASTITVSDSELGLSRDVTGWTPSLFWGEVLLVAYMATRLLYRRWSRWTAWLVSTPVLVSSGVLFFESVARLLPSTY